MKSFHSSYSWKSSTTIQRKIDLTINHIPMWVVATYFPCTKLLSFTFNYLHGIVKEITIPDSEKDFALSILSDLNETLIKEIYKYDILC